MRGFFEAIDKLGRSTRSHILEKDYHLHRVLDKISNDSYLRERLVFKGGTGLIKAYLGYYRFSEDLDFTWRDRGIWEGKSPSQARNDCSTEIDRLLEIFRRIADDLGLSFTGDKGNRDEVSIGGGGRMPRFFLGYDSEILHMPSKIKIEINFVERTLYPFHENRLASYIKDLDSDEIRFLFGELYDEYTRPVSIECYDPREIFVEKCRASMTRIACKLRDIIDIYMLEERYRYKITEYKREIMEKTGFMVDLYRKYRENIEHMTLRPQEEINDEELKLLVIPVPDDLMENIERIRQEIEQIRKEILETL